MWCIRKDDFDYMTMFRNATASACNEDTSLYENVSGSSVTTFFFRRRPWVAITSHYSLCHKKYYFYHSSWSYVLAFNCPRSKHIAFSYTCIPHETATGKEIKASNLERKKSSLCFLCTKSLFKKMDDLFSKNWFDTNQHPRTKSTPKMSRMNYELSKKSLGKLHSLSH